MEMDAVEMNYVVRRVRVLRPVALPIHHIGSFSMSVNFGLSREILYQVVFLLTL